jgi:WD40 repeat protein
MRPQKYNFECNELPEFEEAKKPLINQAINNESLTNLGRSSIFVFNSSIFTSKCPLPIPKHVIEKVAPPTSDLWNMTRRKSSLLLPILKTDFTKQPRETSHHTFTQTESSTIGPEGINGSLSSESLHLNNNPIKKISAKSITAIKARMRKPCLQRIFPKKVKKDLLDFNNLCLQQRIQASDKSMWTARFSFDGNFFATGGADKCLRVWHLADHTQQCNFPHLSLIAAELLFDSKPLREYRGHKADIVDISWSTKVFLIIS